MSWTWRVSAEGAMSGRSAARRIEPLRAISAMQASVRVCFIAGPRLWGALRTARTNQLDRLLPKAQQPHPE